MINFDNRGATTIKWLLPLVFLVGYFITVKSFDGNFVEYVTYTLLAVGSCTVLLARIDLFQKESVAVWVALTLFVFLYFVRFYWISIDASPVRLMLPASSYLTMVENRNALLTAFELSVISFAGFSFSATASQLLMTKKTSHVYQFSDNSKLALLGLISKRSLVIVVPLMIAMAYISYRYHIGEMGALPGEALPFRLKGVIFYIRIITLPLIVLAAIYLAERGGNIATSRLGVLILISHGVTDMVIRNSRSAFLLVLLLLVFLMLADGIRLARKEKILLAVLAALALTMVPIMTEYRSARVTGKLPLADALLYALNVGWTDWQTQIFKGIKFVLFRMPGTEALWNMLSLGAEPLGAHSIDVIKSKDGVAGHLSSVLNPLRESDLSLMATGFVGWFYLVAGVPAIVLGSICTGTLSTIGWNYLDRRYIESGPVAQVLFLWMLFIALTEGNLDSMAYMFIVGALTIIALELSLILLLRNGRGRN
ncbi:MAG: hypothetical protein Q7J42_12690 [Sulfuritalea sp.]|nr:hypothetical protein [Sulfuritalea sp.]